MSGLNHIIDIHPINWAGQKIFSHSKFLTNISEYFATLFLNKIPSKTQKLLFGIGLAFMTYKLVHLIYKQHKFWNFLPEHLSNVKNFKPDKMKQRYGDCYVLITGAADGIGFAYSRQFAKMGFNLIMADIQAEKLMIRRKQLLQSYKNIEIEAFVVDMSELSKIGEFVEKIDKFDIGIIINNVGLTGGGNFLQVDPKLMKKTLFVNFRPMYEVNKHFLSKLRARRSRSAIINMSSATGVYFSHNVGAYSSIKYAMDMYSRTLSIQNKDKIDILSVRPFGVTTGMMKMQKKARMITPKHCATAVLADLGHCDSTFSGLPHKIMASFFASLDEQGRLQAYDSAWKK